MLAGFAILGLIGVFLCCSHKAADPVTWRAYLAFVPLPKSCGLQYRVGAACIRRMTLRGCPDSHRMQCGAVVGGTREGTEPLPYILGPVVRRDRSLCLSVFPVGQVGNHGARKGYCITMRHSL